MVNRHFQRRAILAAMAASTLFPGMAHAEDYIDLDWEDLLPENDTPIPNALRGLLPHDEQAPLISEQPASSGVRGDWNGKIVRLPGFIVPLDYSGTGVSAFILVPYFGACVHTPPPPANQLVFVTTSTPYQSSRLFDPVNVIGMFGVSSMNTHLAEIGYALSADEILPYGA
jgi:hypothetical protein